MNLTDAGRSYVDACKQILEKVEEAERAAAGEYAEPKGDLFITGGDFGLEGSILTTAVSLITILILAWAFERKYRSKA